MINRKLCKLNNKHKQLARLLVQGHTQSEAARLLDMHKSTVSRLVRESLIANEIKRLQQRADDNASTCVPGIPEKIAEGAHKGIEVLEAILNDERTDSDMLKLKANVALELLARAGFGPVKQVNVKQESMSAHFTLEDIEEIKERARQLAKK